MWIPFFIICFLTDTQKVLLFIFGMLAIHECAHLLVAHHFHYEIGPIIIYPFGIGAHIYHMGHGHVWKEILIILAGPATHLLFPLVFEWFQAWGWISQSFTHYLCQINQAILIFNMLLIWPLDGGRMMQSLFHLCFPYRVAQGCTYFFSLVNIVLLGMNLLIFHISSSLVIFFLLFQIIASIHHRAYDRQQFYQYRYRHPFTGRLIAHYHQDLYRQRENLLYKKSGWVPERTWLLQDMSVYYATQSEHASFMM